MIEIAHKTKIIEEKVADIENSHIYCDHCGAEIPINSKLYHIFTGHYDWGSYSIDSTEFKQLCSSACLVDYVANVYTDKHGLHKKDTQFLNIEKRYAVNDYIKSHGEDF